MQNTKETKMVPLNTTSVVAISDIDVASLLMAKGFELESIDRKNSNRIHFLFFQNEQVKQIIEDYWSNKVMVHAHDFAVARKCLKSRIFALKDIQY